MPGQSLTFYKGRIPEYSENSQTWRYDAIVRDVFAEARRLEEEGAIEIRKSSVDIPLPEWKCGNGPKNTVTVDTYTAVGLPNGFSK